jgi:hypothetical protein
LAATTERKESSGALKVIDFTSIDKRSNWRRSLLTRWSLSV